jgi:hypothetical protein
MTLGGLINNLETLPVVVKQEIEDIVLSDAANLNREQLKKGIRGDDEKVQFPDGRTTYSKGYKKLKQRKGLQNKHIDLKFSGEFHKSIETKKRGENRYENTSSDTLYTGKLRQVFTDKVLDLGTEATEKLTQNIVTGVKKLIFKKVK